ncbi:haloacid dehalogenase type II [Pantoea stewartii]|uniref:haloacid dehalogenase type II n=1 Tax=Pantoea stewartii TaxID=66269 RepID=UPI0025A2ABBE|nr:haloacid dehalogenase type II [Pantoea stewartii]
MTDMTVTRKDTHTLFFDVNETLLDTAPLKACVVRRLGNKPERAEAWFTSLLHYSLVESVTGSWHSFGDIAEAVLQMTAERYGITPLPDATSLADALSAMPAFPDVADGLSALKSHGLTLVALTNSSQALAEKQLSQAGLSSFFSRVLSVESLQVYKPDLRVYRWAMDEMKQPATSCMMVAAHGWDVGGAKRAGMKTAFIARPGQTPFPLAPEPDVIVRDIGALAAVFTHR